MRARQSTAKYSNPVLDTDFPDPSILLTEDGWHYAYSSQHTTHHRWAHVPVARSHDLVDWELVGDALPERPGWSLHQWECAWAPHVIAHDGEYRLFYSAMPDDRSGMAIGVAVSHTPQGPFLDRGEPLVSGPGYVCIDPMAFQDPSTGRWYLYWGGDAQPIFVQELRADLAHVMAGSSPIPVLEPDPGTPYERVVEGPFVVFRLGRYYLFYSGDDFSGDPATYAVLVARSATPIGPFERLGEAVGAGSSAILEESARWEGPGHASLFADRAGRDWLVYHAIDRAKRRIPDVDFVRRPMLLDPVDWHDGWPAVGSGRASSERRAAPVT